MTFSGDLKAFAAKVERRNKDIFVGCVNDVRTSVTEGSAVTGAPGQPVDTSALINSWRAEYPETWVGTVASYNIAYAEAIEEGYVQAHTRKAYTRKDGTPVRSHSVKGHKLTIRPDADGKQVGGTGSVKMTRAGWGKLVDAVVEKVVGND